MDKFVLKFFNLVSPRFVLASILLLVSCTKKDSTVMYPKSVTIEFKISGTVTKADISYSVGAELPTVFNNALLPYDLKITKTVAYLDGAMLKATYAVGNSITMTMLVNDVVAETQTCNLINTTSCVINHTFF